MPKNWCFLTVVLEKTLESPLDCKEIKPVNPKGNQFWIFIGRIAAEAEAPILGPPDAKSGLWCWERLRARGEEGNRGWDGWMASPFQWTWVWANSGRLWRTGEPGVLQSMGLQRVGHDCVTEQQQFLSQAPFVLMPASWWDVHDSPNRFSRLLSPYSLSFLIRMDLFF